MSHINTNIPELRDYDSGTVLQNLEKLTSRQTALDDARLAHLFELADAICDDCDNDKDTVESILLSLRDTSAEDDAILDTNSDTQTANITCHLALQERLCIYKRIVQRFNTANIYDLPTQIGESLPADAIGRVAYMKSNVASKAYLKVSSHISNCRATEFYSVEDACAQVNNGQCEYCLLPIESTEGGKLQSFIRLIEKYGLKIAAVCDVSVRSGIDSPKTRFALLRRSMETPDGGGGELGCIRSKDDLIFNSGESYRLELLHRVESDYPSSFTDLLIAAQFCGMRMLRADTSAAVFDDEGDAFGYFPDDYLNVGLYTVFDIKNSDLLTFLWYTALEAPADTVVGIYKELNGES